MNWLAAPLWAAFGVALSAAALPEDALKEIKFDQKLGAQISLNLEFRDEAGKPVKLGNYFGRKPVILVLGYYGCPMLCTAVLNGMIGGLQDLKGDAGRDYEIVSVSIDPHEQPDLAAAKKQTYLARYGRPGTASGWHFLTGGGEAIARLAGEVGYRYAYDPASGQFAHPSGLIILTADGKISRYLFGVDFTGTSLRTALADAAAAKVGSPMEQLFLLCFHYHPLTGRYSGLVLLVVRGCGIAVMLLLGVFIARRAG